MNAVKVIEEKKTISSPPLPPVRNKRTGGDGGGNKQLTAVSKWDGKEYHLECRSRKLTPNFSFHHPELGEVTFAEDQVTLLYSQKELDPQIYKRMRTIIKRWVESFPGF